MDVTKISQRFHNDRVRIYYDLVQIALGVWIELTMMLGMSVAILP